MRAALSLLLLILAAMALPGRAALAPYTDRGKIDFDTAMELLNPYGKWALVGDRWVYTPLNHAEPYTNGRWLYTEYGWFWKGNEPHSWLTEHYGFWKRGVDGFWGWYPAPTWLPQIVEMRASATAVGWRSAEVDSDGNFVEAPADRFAKVDEWIFVNRAQFTRPITPATITPPAETSKLLDESSSSTHTYVTYRPIDRPGPHPADFLQLAGSGGMFPPQIETPVATDSPAPTAAKKPSPTSATNNPTLSSAEGADDDSAADARQVPYWVTMSLPGYWTHAPADALPNQLYIYRPDFYQDQDGIERRIRLWLYPAEHALVGAKLNDILKSGGAHDKGPSTSGGNPFRGQLDTSFPAPSNTPAKPTPAPSGPAPSGLAAPSGRASGLTQPPSTNAPAQ